LRRVVLLAALIGVADQITKWLVLLWIPEGETVPVIDGFYNLVNWRNTGAAWGIFQDYNIVLGAVSAVTILALYLFRHSFQVHRPSCAIALGLIAGGIIGNMVDRFRLGHVVDFWDFYIGARHWPAFNVADSAICVGVAIYLVASWTTGNQSQKLPAA
jgi:signal peptidase II